MQKLCLAVLFGGASSEYEVSCKSAASVLRNLDRSRFLVVKIGITKEGRWLLTDATAEEIEENRWADVPGNEKVLLSADPADKGFYLAERGILQKVDCIFPVMHGQNCEDGALQGLFTLARIPYVGCDVQSSANCMDKERTKLLCAHLGIPQGRWLTILKHLYEKDTAAAIAAIEEAFGYPVFIKPAGTGSSVGISKAHDRAELQAAVTLALQYDSKVLAEEFIDGFEIETAALGNREDFIISPCGSVTPSREFYSYEAKYEDNSSITRIPADIPAETAETVREIAAKVYAGMGCDGLSRIDFFVTKKGEILFNEINTLPGFTSISMYPSLCAAMGVSYTELLTRLVELAANKAQQK